MNPKPKAPTHERPLMATMRLDLALDMNHELVRLAAAIDWGAIAAEFRPMSCPNNGRSAVPTLLMAGLQLLKYTFNLSDELTREEMPWSALTLLVEAGNLEGKAI